MKPKNLKIDLIKVNDLLRLINYVMLTGKLKVGKIVSMLVVSDVEMGKSKMLEVFMNFPTVEWANDLSSKVMLKVILPKAERGEKTHIVIPDLLRILAHNRVVVKNVITLLNSFVEEGIKSSLFYGSQMAFKYPVKGGVICAITKGEYNRRKEYWKDIGFISRCVVISFSYSDETVSEIHDFIASGCNSKNICSVVMPPKRCFDVNIDIKTEAEIIKTIAMERAIGTGFRFHHQLRSLVKAIAYYRRQEKAKKVLKEDITELKNVMRFMNMTFTRL